MCPQTIKTAVQKPRRQITNCNGASGLASRRTQIGHLADLAAGAPRIADTPAVEDEPKADRTPVFWREQSAEVLFDLGRVARAAQSEAPAQPGHVSVYREPWQIEGHRENDIRGLATDARKGGQLLHRPG